MVELAIELMLPGIRSSLMASSRAGALTCRTIYSMFVAHPWDIIPLDSLAVLTGDGLPQQKICLAYTRPWVPPAAGKVYEIKYHVTST